MIRSLHHHSAHSDSSFNYLILFFFFALLALPAQAYEKASITLSYGPESDQIMDVYLPENPTDAPILVLVHGGAWKFGDKGSRAVTKNKLAHWQPQGFILVSVNYRLLPDANPLEQAQDVAQALTYLQSRIANWGGDPDKIILMGHSAGGHLAALISANPAPYQKLKPWRGSVILDSAAMDVPAIMINDHPKLYDHAFGKDQQFWTHTSPLHQLMRHSIPMLLVCSTERDDSCTQATVFTDAAKNRGAQVTMMNADLSHKQINTQLGADEEYTNPIDAFIQRQLKP